MTRQRFDAEELYNLLANAHGIEVREWLVDQDGGFCGIIFDAQFKNEEWTELVRSEDAHPRP